MHKREDDDAETTAARERAAMRLITQEDWGEAESGEPPSPGRALLTRPGAQALWERLQPLLEGANALDWLEVCECSLAGFAPQVTDPETLLALDLKAHGMARKFVGTVGHDLALLLSACYLLRFLRGFWQSRQEPGKEG